MLGETSSDAWGPAESSLNNGQRILSQRSSFPDGWLGDKFYKLDCAMAQYSLFPGFGQISGVSKATIVIGENMTRVQAYASKIGAQTIKMPEHILKMPDGYRKWNAMMQYNREWLFQHLKSGSKVVDIGIDINRPLQYGRSLYYQMEQNVIKYYNMLIK